MIARYPERHKEVEGSLERPKEAMLVTLEAKVVMVQHILHPQ